MAKINISQLSDQPNIADDDIIHIRTTGGVDRKVTGANLKAAVVSLTNNQSIAGVKTFLSTVIGNLTGNVTGDLTGTASALEGSQIPSGQLHTNSISSGNLYTVLAASIGSVVGDKMAIHGIFTDFTLSNLFVASFAQRTTATSIDLHCIRLDNSSLSELNANQGGGGGARMSLSW